MSKPDKKQRHKAKREAKRRELRRRESISPVKRLADAPGEMECWMSDHFGEMGQAQAFVYKRAAGLSGLACFLVDRGVVGLKDAWTRMSLERSEVDDAIDTSRDQGITMRRVTPEDVRRLVAGGIRWAHQHGMRLPKDWVKCASLFGGVGDWASADVSKFVEEFAGHPEDLRQRLIGEPFDSYIRRKDITFVFSDLAPYMDQRTGKYISENDDDLEDLESIVADVPVEELNKMAEQFSGAATSLAGETSKWLEAHGQTPSPELFEAWRSVLLSGMMAKEAKPEASDEEVADFSLELLADFARRLEASRVAEYEEALDQAQEHAEADPTIIQRVALKCGLTTEPGGDGEESGRRS